MLRMSPGEPGGGGGAEEEKRLSHGEFLALVRLIKCY